MTGEHAALLHTTMPSGETPMLNVASHDEVNGPDQT